MNQASAKTQNMVKLALFAGIIVVLSMTPLGYIPLGVIKATTIHIPVILGSILLGWKAGAVLGGIFGLTSLVVNTLTPSLTSFVFTPFYSLDGSGGSFAYGDEETVTAAVAGMVSGMTVANLLGIPLGTYLSQEFSWRYTFLLIAVFNIAKLQNRSGLVRRIDNHASHTKNTLSQRAFQTDIPHTVQQNFFLYEIKQPFFQKQAVFRHGISCKCNGHTQKTLAVFPNHRRHFSHSFIWLIPLAMQRNIQILL